MRAAETRGNRLEGLAEANRSARVISCGRPGGPLSN